MFHTPLKHIKLAFERACPPILRRPTHDSLGRPKGLFVERTRTCFFLARPVLDSLTRSKYFPSRLSSHSIPTGQEENLLVTDADDGGGSDDGSSDSDTILRGHVPDPVGLPR